LTYTIGRQWELEGRKIGLALMLSSFLLWYPLAVFSKETGLLLPLFIGLIEIFFFRFRTTTLSKKSFLIIFSAVIVAPCILAAVYSLFHFNDIVLSGYVGRPFSLWERALTQLRAVSAYVFWILAPIPSVLGFYHDDFPISKGWMSPPTTMAALVFIFALLLMALLARKRLPLVSFGILFFFAGHLLESTIFPLELVYEHRNYLPSYGLIIAAVGAIDAGVKNKNLRHSLPYFPALVFALITWQMAIIWSTPESMYTYMFRTHPNSDRLTILHANVAADNGRFDIARRLLADKDRLGYKINELYLDCQEYRSIPNSKLAQLPHQMAGIIGDYEASGLMNLATARLDNACSFSAPMFLDVLEQAIRMPAFNNITHQKLILYRAHYLHATGKFDTAVKLLEELSHTYPSKPIPLFLATEWLIEQGSIGPAREMFSRALAAAKENGRNYSNIIESIESKFHGSMQAQP
jgi:hypothetical protein